LTKNSSFLIVLKAKTIQLLKQIPKIAFSSFKKGHQNFFFL